MYLFYTPFFAVLCLPENYPTCRITSFFLKYNFDRIPERRESSGACVTLHKHVPLQLNFLYFFSSVAAALQKNGR